MFRINRVLTARHAAMLGALALACSDGSGPGNGSSTGSIGGTVTSGGTGVPGAGIALTGAATANQTTAATGAYLFDDLGAGSYTVTITLPAGFALGAGETAARPVTLGAGDDAGINWTATQANPDLGGIAGSVTAGGSGVQGAGIALSGTGTGNTTTGSNGAYSFTGLAPGPYTLTVTLPAGFVLATGQTAAKQTTVAANQTATVNWTAEQDDVTIVTLSGTSFTPGNVTITVGETVRWVVSNGSHTVTPDNPSQPGVWTGTGQLDAGDTFQHTFTTAGTYDYHCIPHESLGMTGTITVQ
jgi:plastocyanin